MMIHMMAHMMIHDVTYDNTDDITYDNTDDTNITSMILHSIILILHKKLYKK